MSDGVSYLGMINPTFIQQKDEIPICEPDCINCLMFHPIELSQPVNIPNFEYTNSIISAEQNFEFQIDSIGIRSKYICYYGLIRFYQNDIPLNRVMFYCSEKHNNAVLIKPYYSELSDALQNTQLTDICENSKQWYEMFRQYLINYFNGNSFKNVKAIR